MNNDYIGEKPIEFGKYKGKLIKNLPAEYLLYLYNEGGLHKGNLDLKMYITENLEQLKIKANGTKGSKL